MRDKNREISHRERGRLRGNNAHQGSLQIRQPDFDGDGSIMSLCIGCIRCHSIDNRAQYFYGSAFLDEVLKCLRIQYD